MDKKDQFYRNITINSKYDNIEQSITIKYDNDPDCLTILQDFVNCLFYIGYATESISEAIDNIIII